MATLAKSPGATPASRERVLQRSTALRRPAFSAAKLSATRVHRPAAALRHRERKVAPCRALGGEASTPSDDRIFSITVADIMTKGPIRTCTPETTVEDALEILGEYRLTGMPVVDSETGRLIGVVSDSDLISLDAIMPQTRSTSGDIFPATGESWMAFKAIKKMLDTQCAKLVGEIMTQNPITVLPSTPIEEAAGLLIKKNIRRLPVMDDDFNMVGIVSRANIVQAAVKLRKGGL